MIESIPIIDKKLNPPEETAEDAADEAGEGDSAEAEAEADE